MKHNRIFQCAHLDFLVSVGDIVNFVRAKEKARKDWIFTRYVIGSYNEDCQTSNKGQTCQSISRGNTIVGITNFRLKFMRHFCLINQ